ncbi:hypothetical protein BDW74DRAFT_169195 [Aspergillus multicolor]|uniref:agmatinase n=1 Tax=Aspergillus multicolor TaxID=41759 RepID=UPI003CCCEB4C
MHTARTILWACCAILPGKATPILSQTEARGLSQEILASDSNQGQSFIEASIFGRWSRNEDGPFESTATFAHLPQRDCFSDNTDPFDIAVVGAPFDLGVSFRPGARFGPTAARTSSMRYNPLMGYSTDHPSLNPFTSWATIVDCGDIANTPFDKLAAIKQLQHGMAAILSGKTSSTEDGTQRRVITIGGDHTISLPVLRALHKQRGPIAVLHFDSHLDSWDPKVLSGGISKYSDINHGSMFHILAEEGALLPDANVHLGTRSMLFDASADLENDARCGFSIIRASHIDQIGVQGIVRRVKNIVGDMPVYVSIDVDSLDPAFAPATGTLEIGGWSTREMVQVLRGLAAAGIKIVGGDVVEFSPVYDNTAGTTGMAVAHIVYELLMWMVQVPVA